MAHKSCTDAKKAALHSGDAFLVSSPNLAETLTPFRPLCPLVPFKTKKASLVVGSPIYFLILQIKCKSREPFLEAAS